MLSCPAHKGAGQSRPRTESSKDKITQGQNRPRTESPKQSGRSCLIYTRLYPTLLFDFRSILVRLRMKLIDSLICIDVFWYNKALLLLYVELDILCFLELKADNNNFCTVAYSNHTNTSLYWTNHQISSCNLLG